MVIETHEIDHKWVWKMSFFMLVYFFQLKEMKSNEPRVKMTHSTQFLHPISVRKAEMGSKNRIFHAAVF